MEQRKFVTHSLSNKFYTCFIALYIWFIKKKQKMTDKTKVNIEIAYKIVLVLLLLWLVLNIIIVGWNSTTILISAILNFMFVITYFLQRKGIIKTKRRI